MMTENPPKVQLVAYMCTTKNDENVTFLLEQCDFWRISLSLGEMIHTHELDVMEKFSAHSCDKLDMSILD